MKARHMHVKIQSMEVRIKARHIDFWRQFPSISKGRRPNIERKWAHKTKIWQECWLTKKTENNRRFGCIFVCYSFYCIFDYWKMGEFLPKRILFLQKMILNNATRSIWYENRQILLCF